MRKLPGICAEPVVASWGIDVDLSVESLHLRTMLGGSMRKLQLICAEPLVESKGHSTFIVSGLEFKVSGIYAVINPLWIQVMFGEFLGLGADGNNRFPSLIF